MYTVHTRFALAHKSALYMRARAPCVQMRVLLAAALALACVHAGSADFRVACPGAGGTGTRLRVCDGAAAVGAPLAPVPGYQPGRPQIMEAMKQANNAIAALQFQDVDTAVGQLTLALQTLTMPPPPPP